MPSRLVYLTLKAPEIAFPSPEKGDPAIVVQLFLSFFLLDTGVRPKWLPHIVCPLVANSGASFVEGAPFGLDLSREAKGKPTFWWLNEGHTLVGWVPIGMA